MERRVRRPRMECPSPSTEASEMSQSLLSLPDATILEVMRHLDGRSLVSLARSASYFTRKDPVTSLPLADHVARENLLRLCLTSAEAERFRRRSWTERLYLQQDARSGFDRAHCEEAGFKFGFSPDCAALRSIRLVGMGPKLLVSDATTATQPVLRWQLRVKGNTAVEFGVIPAAMEPAHTALHKCLNVPDKPQERSMGFCSQITAGSLLPLKAPVMRGTVLDLLAKRGRVEVVLRYPPDAKEITWHNGQPVHKPYRGPSELRLEQDFSDDFDVRLALTSWAKGSFEVLHAPDFNPAWAADCVRAEAEAAAAAAAAKAAPSDPALGAGALAAAAAEQAAVVALPTGVAALLGPAVLQQPAGPPAPALAPAVGRASYPGSLASMDAAASSGEGDLEGAAPAAGPLLPQQQQQAQPLQLPLPLQPAQGIPLPAWLAQALAAAAAPPPSQVAQQAQQLVVVLPPPRRNLSTDGQLASPKQDPLP